MLLADEPTGNLDEDTRDEIIGLLEKLWQDNGLTMIMVTHDSSVARRAQRLGIDAQRPAHRPAGKGCQRPGAHGRGGGQLTAPLPGAVG